MVRPTKIDALRFTQWMPEWDNLEFEAQEFRRKPSPDMLLFSMQAEELRALSGVFRRSRAGGVATGIQRSHDEDRSVQIRDYVRFGYPYSEMGKRRRESFDSADLKKPGWLPTAIVVNILTDKDRRRGQSVFSGDIIKVTAGTPRAELQLPKSFSSVNWSPKTLPPLEIIDGQHRLYAFDGVSLPGTFQLPVVAFHGLDIGWQAYLFWSINVSPKKINPSHAFDLYPLLRSQDWLEKFAESNVYREARAQELTEFMFSHPESPWHGRINMLGERGVGGVSQAAWVRALASTYLSAGRGRGAKGLFGSSVASTGEPLPWNRAQQAAFLINLWSECEKAIKASQLAWVRALRSEAKDSDKNDLAFSGANSMLNQEQGVRAILSVSNELFFAEALQLSFADWDLGQNRGETTHVDDVSAALKSLRKQKFTKHIRDVALRFAAYDWRASQAPELSNDERLKRRAFRGSGGYAVLHDELLKALSRGSGDIADQAKRLVKAHG